MVTPFYDPMVAKISVYGNDRGDAIQAMKSFLEELVISPLTTNRDFLIEVMSASDYYENQVDTTWLERFAKALHVK